MSPELFNSFYEENIRLVHSVALKGHRRLEGIGASIGYNDLFQEMSIVFLKTLETFDEEKGKFSPYFFKMAFFRINKIAEKFEIERAVCRSTQEIASDRFDGEVDVVLESIGDDRAGVEDVVSACELIEKIMENISPLAQKIFEWAIMPPAQVKKEIEARYMHAELSRGLGLHRRYIEPNGLALACEMLEIAGVDAGEIKRARLQLEREIRRHA